MPFQFVYVTERAQACLPKNSIAASKLPPGHPIPMWDFFPE
jgi:hypothetical protein